MCSVAAAFSLDLVRAGTMVVIACFKSTLSRSSELNSGLSLGEIKRLDQVFKFSNPSLKWLAVMKTQIIENQEDLFIGILDKATRNSMSLSELNASLMIIQRVLPWLVTVAIVDIFLSLASGVCRRLRRSPGFDPLARNRGHERRYL